MTQLSGNAAQPQAGSRIGLMGFEAAGLASLTSQLEESGLEVNEANPAELSRYTAILLSARACLDNSLPVPLSHLFELPTPVIATGTCAEMDVMPSLQVHAAEFVVSPFCARELVMRVRRAVARADHRPVRAADNRTVLIADDDPSVAKLAAGMLKSLGLECHIATDGAEALERARILLPEFMILDVRLPYLNGLDVLHALRTDPGTASIKVMMLTGENNLKTVGRCRELGVDDFVTKPFQAMDFLKRVRALMLPPAPKTGPKAARNGEPVPA